MISAVKYLFAYASIMFLGACSVLSVEPETVSLTSKSIKMNFVEKAPSGRVITDADILLELIEQIKKSSGVRGLSEYTTSVSGLNDLKGVSVSRKGEAINVAYVNGAYYRNTGTTLKTETVATYGVKIVTKNNLKQVSVATPTSVELKPGRNNLMIPFQPLLPTKEVVADIERINSKLNIKFSDAKTYKGEFNAKYGDASVYANFERLLGNYEYRSGDVNKYDIKKDKLFTLGDGADRFPVKITVYPYRNGSKVQYEFQAPYTINGDGTTTFNKNKMQEYIASIKKIAED